MSMTRRSFLKGLTGALAVTVAGLSLPETITPEVIETQVKPHVPESSWGALKGAYENALDEILLIEDRAFLAHLKGALP